MIKTIARKVLLFNLWVVFIFVLLQAAGFLYFDVLNIKAIGGMGYPNGLFVSHDELDYLYTPNFQGKFLGGAYHDIRVDINEHGFRDDAYTEKPGNFRLLALGDSVVFGSGVRKEDRFTEHLENGRWAKEHQLEVLNLGVNSYSFPHYLSLARLDFFGLQPDFILVGFTLNDIAVKEEAWPARRYGRLKSTSKSSKPNWLRYSQKVMDRTYSGRLLRELKSHWKARFTSDDNKEAYHTKWMRSVDRRWRNDEHKRRLYDEIVAFDTLMAKRNIPYAFLIFPEMNDLQSPGRFNYPRDQITSFLRDRQIPFCDAYPVFSEFAGDLGDLFLPHDSVHFTPRGHELVSGVVAECLSAFVPAANG